MARNRSRKNYTQRSGFKRKSKGGLQRPPRRSGASLDPVMGPRSAAPAPSPTPPVAPPTQPSAQAQPQSVNLLEALGLQRREMGFETSSIEEYVTGGRNRRGVRDVLQDFIDANAEKFNAEDPAAMAAFELMESAAKLSDESLNASQEEAVRIYAKLKFIRDLANKTQGEQSEVAEQLKTIIEPIEKQMKERASFRGFLKEKIQDFRKTLPERLVSKIPIVGGLLGDFFKQKRVNQEELEAFSTSIQRDVARRGRLTGNLSLPGTGRRQRGGVGPVGGTRASDIPGLGSTTSGLEERENVLETRRAEAFPTATLKSIYKEVVIIRKSVQKIAKAKGVGDGEGGLMDTIQNRLFGRKSRFGRLVRRGKIGLKRLMRGVKARGGRLLNRFFGRNTKAGRLLRRGRIGGKMLMRSAGRGIGRVASGVGRGISRAASAVGRGLGSVASTAGRGISGVASTVGRGIGSVASSAGGWLSRAWGSVSGAVSNLNPAKALGSAIKSGAGKVAKGIISIPGIGALLSAAMGAFDIASIKKDPDLSPEEKKEQIGKRLVGTLGEVLGSIGGGILGSLIPGIGQTGIGTLLGSMGGAWVGGKIAELLADAIGGKGIYDMVASIPGIGSLIEVGGAEDQKEKTAAEQQVNKTTTGAEGQLVETQATGTISAPATPNTTVGRMANQLSAEQAALSEAQAAAAAVGTATAAPVSNNSVVQTKINNTTNNFNDDLRIRNNEPTLKTMQMASHTF